jgi:DNA polymerase
MIWCREIKACFKTNSVMPLAKAPRIGGWRMPEWTPPPMSPQNAAIIDNRFYLDCETACELDLSRVGLDAYLSHPSARILCVAVAVNAEPATVWHPGEPVPDAMVQSLQDPACEIIIHNAQFDLAVARRILTSRHGWPLLSGYPVRDTMSEALALGLPAGLALLGQVLGLTFQKDAEGYALMRRVTRPLKARKGDTAVSWNEDPDDLRRLDSYAARDVETLRELAYRLPRLPPQEHRFWKTDSAVNERGIAIDLDLARGMVAINGQYQRELNQEISDWTGGAVTATTQVPRIIKWAAERGVAIGSLNKKSLAASLLGDLPADVRRVLELRRCGSLSSLAKPARVITACGADGRLRYSFKFFGSHTGRYTATGPQVQNFPKINVADLRGHDGVVQPDAEAVVTSAVATLRTGRLDLARRMFADVPAAMRACLRPLLVAGSGCELLGGDFSQIEPRLLAWISNETWRLQAYAAGVDLYVELATEIFDATVPKQQQRDASKTCELAFSYGGRINAFRQFLKPGMPTFTDEQIEEIHRHWKRKNPAIVRLWGRLWQAAWRTMRLKLDGVLVPVNDKVGFIRRGDALCLILPSGREVVYPQCRIAERPQGEQDCRARRSPQLVLTYKEASRKAFTEYRGGAGLWFGSLTENLIQACARDVLLESIERLTQHGFSVVFHCHDEVVVEVNSGSDRLVEFEQLMSTAPSWAEGLPLAVKCWRGPRYSK